MPKRKIGLVTTLLLIFAWAFPAPAISAPISECKINASSRQIVSLGFPVATERLLNKPNPRILVVPYRLSDRPDFTFGEVVRNEYLAAGRQIEAFSNGLSKPVFIFSDVIDVKDTVKDMEALRARQQSSWQSSEATSTWGFVREFVATHDSKLDFTNIDGMVMHGSSTSSQSSIAEAMMFVRDPANSWLSPSNAWFRPINTAEGQLLNVVLLDQRTSISTITHELLHLYGLTDLYGTSTGPGNLSIMASNQDTLLSYEKWVLGWLSDNQVQCILEQTEIDQTKVSTTIKIPTQSDQLVVIKSNQDSHAYVIETSTWGASRHLAFYSLDNEARPPITMHQAPLSSPGTGLTLSNTNPVGLQLISPKYNLLVSNLTDTELTLDLIPKAQLPAAASLIFIAQSTKNQIDEARRQSAAQTQPKPDVAKPKQKTITCVKGKVIRKVKAVNPKCPAGFKRK